MRYGKYRTVSYSRPPVSGWGVVGHAKYHPEWASEISFGINFQPAPLSLEIGASINMTTTNYILSPSEDAIISNMKKQADANRKILFVADNFEMWDMPSKQLLQKIMHPLLGLFSGYHLNVLVVAHSKLFLGTPIPWKSIGIPDIPDESMLHILRENGYAEQICIKDIRACAGNDLSLALMAANYYAENGENASDFIDIMDRRCDRFCVISSWRWIVE